MRGTKIRLMAIGAILIAVGTIRYEFLARSDVDLVILGIGVAVLVVGLIWP